MAFRQQLTYPSTNSLTITASSTKYRLPALDEKVDMDEKFDMTEKCDMNERCDIETYFAMKLGARFQELGSIFAIPSTHHSVQKYERLEQTIFDLILCKLGTNFKFMSLFRFGRTMTDSSPTIVVIVKPGTVHEWQLLEWSMTSTLLGTGINTAFLPGHVGNIASSTPQTPPTSPTSPTPPTPPKAPGMGSSLGPHQDLDWKGTIPEPIGMGTLGGFVKVKVGQTHYKCAFTCHHVVRPSASSTSNDQDHTHGYDFKGVENPTICHPSDEAFAGIARSKTRGLKEMREELQENQQSFSQRPFISEGRRKMLESYKSHIQNLEEQIDSLFKSHHVILGKVLVSSRSLNDNKLLLDWALINLNKKARKKHFGSNLIPRLERVHTEPYNMEFQAPLAWQPEAKTTKGIGEMAKDTWYFKNGCITGVTAGICNGVSGCSPALGMGSDAKAYSIISHSDTFRAEAPMENLQNFLEPGDSGALIIDREGRVCGILFALVWVETSKNGPTFISGLVSPMTDILSALNERTPGQEVELQFDRLSTKRSARQLAKQMKQPPG